MKPTYFIIAGSLRQAEAFATVDLGWKQVARDRWISLAGDEFRYCGNDGGQPWWEGRRGSIVCLGPAHYTRRDWRWIAELLREGFLVEVKFQ